MEKVKKVVKEEVEAVQITRMEFAHIAAQECTDMLMAFTDEGEPSPLDTVLPLVCAKYAAHLMARIFDDKNEESEEKKDA